MTDIEIEKYLNEHNWSVDPSDFIHDVLNTSPQIYEEKLYDPKNSLLTIQTPNTRFTFHWKLRELFKEGVSDE